MMKSWEAQVPKPWVQFVTLEAMVEAWGLFSHLQNGGTDSASLA
jgi:hypothetical protein